MYLCINLYRYLFSIFIKTCAMCMSLLHIFFPLPKLIRIIRIWVSTGFRTVKKL